MSGERLARSRSAANPPFDHIGFNAGQSKNGQSPAQMRFEKVFLSSVRPIVLSLTRATIFNATTWSSSICSVRRVRPSGGVEQASAINFASPAPSNIRSLAELGERLGVSTLSTPSSTSCWRTRATVLELVSKPSAICERRADTPQMCRLNFPQVS
jgi:hypothetical protein